MSAERPHLVGAVLPKSRAASATLALQEVGLAGHELDASIEEDLGPAVVGDPERGVGRGMLRGAIIGALILAAGMAILAYATTPPEARVVGAVTGAVSGLVAGSILGGYLGMVSNRRRLWRQRDIQSVETGPHEVLIVVDGAHQPAEAELILIRHGGRIIAPADPDRH